MGFGSDLHSINETNHWRYVERCLDFFLTNQNWQVNSRKEQAKHEEVVLQTQREILTELRAIRHHLEGARAPGGAVRPPL